MACRSLSTPPLPYQVSALLHTAPGLPLDVAVKGMMALGVLSAAYGAYRLGAPLLAGVGGRGLRRLSLRADHAARVVHPGQHRPIPRLDLLTLGGLVAHPPIHSEHNSPAHGLCRRAGVRPGGALLSHNAAALLLMGMIASLALVLYLATRDLRGLILRRAGSLLGLAISAWFWAPRPC